MLKDLFPKHHHRYEDSRYGGELESFAAWLADQGHLRHPLRLHLHRVREVLEHSNGLQSESLLFEEAQLLKAFIVSGPSAYLYLCSGRIFVRFLAATHRLTRVEPDDLLNLLVRRYQQHLCEACGYAHSTLAAHTSTVTDFMLRGLPPERGLAGLSVEDVEAYIQIKSEENNRQSLQHVIAHLRAFLRYCADHNEAPQGTDIIDTPRVYRGELLPRALDWIIVRKLLASIRRRSPRDWRDYTILHLMAYYGLRPSEVASLCLASIDWEAGTLRVEQRKTHSVLMLPLAHRTVRLILRYLKSGRPESNLPQLFLRVRSPITALKHDGVIEVFNYRAAQSGLSLKGASSYSLRHAFAMRLLRRGVGIKAIGDLLGHHSIEATAVYLRIDADMLRTVALPVPGATAV